jgi:glutamate-1-semialdehyde 2,1-aminomutase
MDKIALLRRALRESQDLDFPYRVKALGLDLEVHRNVFSSSRYQSWRWFTERLPSVIGCRVLEIGCGTGVTSLYLAKNGAKHVVAVDINPAAVRNTIANARMNGIQNIEVLESDLFSAIDREPIFDLIYWATPFTRVPADHEVQDVLELSILDPGWRMLRRFLSEAPGHLAEGGRIVLSFGDTGEFQAFCDVAAASDLSVTLIAEREERLDDLVSLKICELRPAR